MKLKIKISHIFIFSILLAAVMAMRPALVDPGHRYRQSLNAAGLQEQSLIPINFTIPEEGYVTLVIETEQGFRVRNLISETWFKAGRNTVWWDGTDDLGRDSSAARHALYQIPHKFVTPGKYKVRGLYRKAITPRYEFSVYSPGTPPWPTPDHTGAWLANHSAPKAALSLPAKLSPTGEPAVLLGCYVTEGPDGFAWVDLDGRKRGGKKWIGGSWTAAPFIAGDKGDLALQGISAYVASTWDEEKGSGQMAVRINALSKTSNDFKVKEISRVRMKVLQGIRPRDELSGFAVYNGLAAVSLLKRNQVIFIDLKTGKQTSSITINSPKGLAYDRTGRLLVITEKRILRYSISSGNPSGPESYISSDLDQPEALTSDASGNLYISDRGKSHTVKVFDSNGSFVRNIGRPGLPKAGPYDQMHMNNPAGISIDEKNQLWVTEEDYLPKRVSVWSLDGKLIRAFYGPVKYGGGGKLDPVHKDRFYYADGPGAMEFSLNWPQGTATLKNVYYRTDTESIKPAFRSAAPETPLYFHGKRYFTNAFNTNPTGGHTTAFLYIDKGGVISPVAAMGKAADWSILRTGTLNEKWLQETGKNKKGKIKDAFFIWQDENADGTVQYAEVTFLSATAGGITVMPDLSFCIARLNNQSVKFRPVRFNAQGVPLYNIKDQEILANDVYRPESSGGNQVISFGNGWNVITLGLKPFDPLSISGTKNGIAKWSYPNLWPGLHASHHAPLPDRAGELIGPTRLLGPLMEFEGTPVPPLWAINGNQGSIYLFTADGLFAAEIFRATGIGKKWNMPAAVRNMALDSLTLGEENFWPSITKTADGEVYLVDGSRSSIVRLDGIKTIRYLPEVSITVSKADLERCRASYLEQESGRQQVAAQKELKIPILSEAPKIDGKLDDWKNNSWVDIEQPGNKATFNTRWKFFNIKGSIAISGKRMYIAYITGDPKLPQNNGDLTALFKTGGALDLMIGTDSKADPGRKTPVNGDFRLLVSLVKGKPLALLYKAVMPGTRSEDKIRFSSPVSTITIDKIENVSTLIEFAGADGNFEFSIPLEILGLKPQANMKIKGDIGILRGEQGETVSRIYWNNKATGITADIPSEAMLTPSLWGTFLIQK